MLFNAAFDAGHIVVINLRTGEVTRRGPAAEAHTFTVTEHFITGCALSRDGTAIVTDTGDGLVLWDVATGTQVAATRPDADTAWVGHVLMSADYILTVTAPFSVGRQVSRSIGLWQVGPA